jgi:hypothetical protein
MPKDKAFDILSKEVRGGKLDKEIVGHLIDSDDNEVF